jgi:hypothetical protein
VDASTNTATDISGLSVSDAWKQLFALIQRAGGPPLKNFQSLSFGERMRVGMNFLAFLFGPFYYAAKGMWRKGDLPPLNVATFRERISGGANQGRARDATREEVHCGADHREAPRG